MLPAENDPKPPANPMGASPTAGNSPPPAPGRVEPAPGGEASSNGTGPGPAAGPEQPPVDDRIRVSLSQISAATEGIQAEVAMLRKKQRSTERQLIMLFGVLAVIAWKTAGSQVRGAIADARPTIPVE